MSQASRKLWNVMNNRRHLYHLLYLTLKMTSALVVKTSVNVTSNGPSQDYTHPGDYNLHTPVLVTIFVQEWVHLNGSFLLCV